MSASDLIIHQVTLPVPFPLKTANVYLVGTGAGTILIDTAFYSPDAWAALRGEVAVFTAVHGQLGAIVLTHHHPDHIGMAGRLQEHYGVPVLASPGEAELVGRVWGPDADGGGTEFYKAHGMPAAALRSITRELDDLLAALAPLPLVDWIPTNCLLALAGAEFVPVLTPGHSPAHLCLFHPPSATLFVGDHLLPRITPNIGWYPYSGPDPLRDFLSALDAIEHLPVREAYPGHGAPILDIRARIAGLRAHHAERLRAVRALLDGTALTGYQVAEGLFGAGLPPQQARLAVVEMLAHLEHLRQRGDVAITWRHARAAYRAR
ncbi:MAG TPA: MBL fold metallo-hydrolase [bacterium]|nr:MBL fold metallo-hydrolase [bacterium]